MFGVEPLYWIFINSFVSFLFLFLISKILGKKQIAELEFIDYVVGISLGSIASNMATDSELPFYYYLIAMTIFFALSLFISIVGRKIPFFKRLVKGKPLTLIYEGKIVYKQLKKSKIDVNDLLEKLREKGFFDINDVAYAVFETSGDISVLPKESKREIVLEDIKQNCNDIKNRASFCNVLVADGVISKSGLNQIKKGEGWLFEQLNIQKSDDLKQIILAVYDDNSKKIVVHYKDERKNYLQKD